MNKKLIVKNEFQKIVYCVLSDAEPYKEQLMNVLAIHAGCGYTVDFGKEKLRVLDCRTNETVGTFEIISFEDTKEEVVLNWKTQDRTLIL